MLAIALVAIVAAIHVYILVLEMLLWTRPFGRRVFGTTAEFAAESKVLAANQGLYNGFLAAGLVWGLIWAQTSAGAGHAVQVFFLGCVIVAGIYGAYSVSRRIFVVQALPAIVGLALLWIFR